ncbi:MAG: hypothetical protein IJU76_14170 [Desulfovibrionaceae bacterium]|nr:hypothetical protein [Desulfovibrionaceae bacterium]
MGVSSGGKKRIRGAVEEAKTFDDIVEIIGLVCSRGNLKKELARHTAIKDEALTLIDKLKEERLRPIEARELWSLVQAMNDEAKERFCADHAEVIDMLNTDEQYCFTQPLMEDTRALGREVLSEKWQAISNRLGTIEEINARLSISDRVSDLQDKILKITKDKSQDYSKDEQWNHLVDELTDLLEKQNTIYSKYEDITSDLESVKQSVYDDILGMIKKQSPVTEELANAWVEENVYFCKGAKAKLKKIGYDEEEFKKDAAEFYQLVGGKIGPVQFFTTESDRSFAQGRTSIAISNKFDKEVLFHELGHLVEGFDKNVYHANRAFIVTRATGDPKRLNTLSKLKYRNNEIAYPDHFTDPYVGKIYSHDSTEVLSMGIQNFISPTALAHFIDKDKEHFELIIGCCAKKSLLAKLGTEEAQESLSREINTAKEKKNNNDKFFKMLDKFLKSISFASRVQSDEGYGGFMVVTHLARCYVEDMHNGSSYNLKSKSKKSTIQLAYLLAVNKKQGLAQEVLPTHKVALILEDPCSYAWPMAIINGSETFPEV